MLDNENVDIMIKDEIFNFKGTIFFNIYNFFLQNNIKRKSHKQNDDFRN